MDVSAVIWILLICVAASLVYGPSLRFFFSQDDFVFLARAARIASLGDFLRSFTAADHFYRPVPRVVMFMAQLRLFGLNAGAFHLVSLGLHTLNAVLLFLLCRRLFSTMLLAGLSGLLYVAHHIPFLAVYWVSGVQDLCVTGFLLISLHVYLRSIETRGHLWFVLSLLVYGLALLSKEMAVTLPLLLILVESVRARWTGCRPWLGQLAGRVWSYGALLGLYLLVRSQKTTKLLPAEGPYAWSFAPRIMLRNFYIYLCDTLYVRGWLNTAPQWAMWASITLLVVFVVLIWRSHCCRSVVALGMGWFLISLLPVLFLSQRAYSFYAYFPLAGVAMMLASLVNVVLGEIRHWVHRLSISTEPICHLMENVGVLLLLIGWLWFSASQVRATEARDPAGIISKSVLAHRAITEVQALYPELPVNSTLYIVGLTDRDVWASGHGDLFRLYYPQVKVVLVPQGEEGQIAASDAESGYVYRFGEGE